MNERGDSVTWLKVRHNIASKLGMVSAQTCIDNGCDEYHGSSPSQLGLFISHKNSKAFLAKLEKEVEVYEEWRKILNELCRKAKDWVFINELESIGPKGLVELKALNRLTQNELEEYLVLYHKKKQLEKERWLSIIGEGGSTVTKYRRKPNVVDAFKWTGGQDQTEDPEWFIEELKTGNAKIHKQIEEAGFYDDSEPEVEVLAIWIEIETLEGTMRADQGDYIVKGIKGEIYPCKPNIFEANHEIIEYDADKQEVDVASNNNLINPDDYDVVICVDGRVGRLFEHGKDTTSYVNKIELSHEAGSRAKLTVNRSVFSKDVVKRLENE